MVAVVVVALALAVVVGVVGVVAVAVVVVVVLVVTVVAGLGSAASITARIIVLNIFVLFSHVSVWHANVTMSSLTTACASTLLGPMPAATTLSQHYCCSSYPGHLGLGHSKNRAPLVPVPARAFKLEFRRFRLRV